MVGLSSVFGGRVCACSRLLLHTTLLTLLSNSKFTYLPQPSPALATRDFSSSSSLLFNTFPSSSSRNFSSKSYWKLHIYMRPVTTSPQLTGLGGDSPQLSPVRTFQCLPCQDLRYLASGKCFQISMKLRILLETKLQMPVSGDARF